MSSNGASCHERVVWYEAGREIVDREEEHLEEHLEETNRLFGNEEEFAEKSKKRQPENG